jgi:phage tail sheath gpL-like
VELRTVTKKPINFEERTMNEETLNLSLRKFLKMVGVSSQGEIEKAVARALAESAINGTETLPVTMTLEVAGIGLNVKFEGDIKLE